MKLNELFSGESFGVTTPSAKEVAKKHRVPLEKILSQLEKGVAAEKEHTEDETMAREIALDHLAETPDYYDRLEDMEDEIDEELTRPDIRKIEQDVDPEFDNVDIDVDLGGNHFVQRANDRRNRPEISAGEIKDVFLKTLDQNEDDFDQMKSGDEVVLTDKGSDLNVPVLFKGRRRPGKSTNREELDMIAKTIMRKPNFKTNNHRITAR